MAELRSIVIIYVSASHHSWLEPVTEGEQRLLSAGCRIPSEEDADVVEGVSSAVVEGVSSAVVEGVV